MSAHYRLSSLFLSRFRVSHEFDSVYVCVSDVMTSNIFKRGCLLNGKAIGKFLQIFM